MLTALDTYSLAFFGLPGNSEIFILVFLGLLIFGRRLPDVGRSLGRSIVEFKKGVKGIQEEVDEASKEDSKRAEQLEDKSKATAPIDPQVTEAAANPYAAADKPQTQE